MPRCSSIHITPSTPYESRPSRDTELTTKKEIDTGLFSLKEGSLVIYMVFEVVLWYTDYCWCCYWKLCAGHNLSVFRNRQTMGKISTGALSLLGGYKLVDMLFEGC